MDKLELSNQIQLNFGEHFQDESIQQNHEIQQQKILINTKNLKWTQEEHTLYIVFLDLNREKIKSKTIRRSNAFFQQMSVFIKSKSPIQCRSHHQKYEEKNRFPHRIIKIQKEKMNIDHYNIVLKNINEDPLYADYFKKLKSEKEENSQRIKPYKQIKTTQVGCQTDIGGLNLTIVNEQQYAKMQNLNNFNYYQHFNNFGSYYTQYFIQ